MATRKNGADNPRGYYNKERSQPSGYNKVRGKKEVGVISMAAGVVRRVEDVENKNIQEVRNELKEIKQDIANLIQLFKAKIKMLGNKIDNITYTCTCYVTTR